MMSTMGLIIVSLKKVFLRYVIHHFNFKEVQFSCCSNCKIDNVQKYQNNCIEVKDIKIAKLGKG